MIPSPPWDKKDTRSLKKIFRNTFIRPVSHHIDVDWGGNRIWEKEKETKLELRIKELGFIEEIEIIEKNDI